VKTFDQRQPDECTNARSHFQGLWTGNAREAREVRAVLSFGIGAVVDLAMEEPPILFPRDVIYCRFPLVDGAGNLPAVVKAAVETTNQLIRGNVPTLVACGAGMSRSAAIVAVALARFEGITLQQALSRVAASGPHDVSGAFWADVQQASDA
jgi:protein-tyrosine phosphatase